VQLELQAREHINIGARSLTVSYEHSSGDVEQRGTGFDSPGVTSNL
jgi:hypothetical protein